MRIAQLAPLYESVPPKLYGGTERVVFWLTEELVRLGHDVTLFASWDSQTSARLVAPCGAASRLDETCDDPLARHFVLLERAFRDPAAFDVIHAHIDYLPYPLARRTRTPFLSTLHGRLDLRDLAALYREYRDIPVVSISDAQREPLPWLNWQATVHHGMPDDLHRFGGGGGYLLFLGRISPEKGPDRAIEIAKRAGMPVKIAAKVDKADREYFESGIRHLLDHPLVEFLGEVDEEQKGSLLRGAYALLFPVDWPEPFGLVMIEAMACGTPVIAFCRGSVPEIVEDGVNGFIVRDVEDAVLAVERAGALSRRQCRALFEQRFTSWRMAQNYLRVYERISAGRRVIRYA